MRRECGVFHNRGRYIATLIMLPITIIFFFSEPILIFIGQDEEVSQIASRYVWYMVPGVWSMG
jgi:MATE family multidrug resistance protein